MDCAHALWVVHKTKRLIIIFILFSATSNIVHSALRTIYVWSNTSSPWPERRTRQCNRWLARCDTVHCTEPRYFNLLSFVFAADCVDLVDPLFD